MDAQRVTGGSMSFTVIKELILASGATAAALIDVTDQDTMALPGKIT